MDIYTVAFFGHRYIENPFVVKDRLELLISDLLRTKQYVVFWSDAMAISISSFLLQFVEVGGSFEMIIQHLLYITLCKS